MLQLFRKYQRFLFIFITVIIIISFSFFGTYSTIGELTPHQRVVFTAIDGSDVTRSEVEEMANFIGTDKEDKLLYGGAWGPNFLNNGVIKNDFLQTGIGEILVENYKGDLAADFEYRFAREKRYTPYVNSEAQFISAATAWNYFAPDINKNLEAFKTLSNPLNGKGFSTRANLYLAEKSFPQGLLKQVLRYQEQQYKWVKADKQLEELDLSLFGYHTAEDWFGPRFIRLVAEYIINAAKIAEARGYNVTSEEALADLIRNTQMSYKELQGSPYFTVTNSEDYFSEQLRRMGMDRAKAVKLWRQVLLFRRLYQDLGNSTIVDPIAFDGFLNYSHETATGEQYQLPQALRLANYRALQKFEVYLDAVAKRSGDLLSLPQQFLSAAEVAKKYPELVQKRYVIEVAQADKNNLQGKVTIKETWNWQLTDSNWELLKKTFPDIGSKKGDTVEERIAILDNLDVNTKAKVDALARNAIVESHPEWLNDALAQAPKRKIEVALREQGGNFPLEGVQDRKAFLALLEKASPIDAEQNNEADQKLVKYTDDFRHFYAVKVVSKAPQQEIVTFVEADRDGTLNKLLDGILQAYYEKIRASSPADFQKSDKSWKDYADVSSQVADRYFAKVLEAIKKDFQANKDTLTKDSEKEPAQFNGDFAAAHRFFAYVRQMKNQLVKDPASAEAITRDSQDLAKTTTADQVPALDQQWKIERSALKLERSGKDLSGITKEEVLAMNPGSWSAILAPTNGALSFFIIKDKKAVVDFEARKGIVEKVQRLLSKAAQQSLMESTLAEISQKQAISLDYMRPNDSASMEP